MNRTPRSASRRASRQLAANEPSAPLHAVQVEHVLRLVGDVHQLRHARLHAEGQLVLGDARGDLRVLLDGVAHAVELVDRVDHVAAAAGDRRPAGC